ncbi:MAG: hypothetical protein C0595_09265 [Marinilabiliales bacterium]|nr:MAG: hypothetical protein C0595_09265 [Marinilabiliales bacterium]
MKKLNLEIKYPQNYIIEKPVTGAFILFVFILGFTIIYQPLEAQKSQWFNFEITIFLYSFITSFTAWLTIILLKKVRFFSGTNNWSILKELIAVYLVLQVMGIAIFLAGFIFESSTEVSRWNFTTFFDSCKYSFLIGILPFAFFTAKNYRHRFQKSESFELRNNNKEEDEILININSNLKKESLTFRANEFLFVTSDGNYAIFYLYRNNEIKKVSIRNSISKIEKQLSEFPNFFRCHRAFIVNINKVVTKKGNALGYLLNIANCDIKVPVSRQKVKIFDSLLNKTTH